MEHRLKSEKGGHSGPALPLTSTNLDMLPKFSELPVDIKARLAGML